MAKACEWISRISWCSAAAHGGHMGVCVCAHHEGEVLVEEEGRQLIHACRHRPPQGRSMALRVSPARLQVRDPPRPQHNNTPHARGRLHCCDFEASPHHVPHGDAHGDGLAWNIPSQQYSLTNRVIETVYCNTVRPRADHKAKLESGSAQ